MKRPYMEWGGVVPPANELSGIADTEDCRKVRTPARVPESTGSSGESQGAQQRPEPDGKMGTHTKLRITMTLAFSLYLANRY
jgi:hypothetical protein